MYVLTFDYFFAFSIIIKGPLSFITLNREIFLLILSSETISSGLESKMHATFPADFGASVQFIESVLFDVVRARFCPFKFT